MKKITIITLIYFLGIVYFSFAQQSLVPVDGFYGGTVNSICTTENGKIFIGTDGGTYAYDADNEEWELKSEGLDQLKINDIIEVDGNLFAASEYSTGVYFSDNYGETWSKKIIMLGEFETGYLTSFVETEFKGKKIIYGASGTSLYKSEDAGMNWQYMKIRNLSGMGAPIVISDDGDIYTGSWSNSSPSMFRATLENDTVWSHFQAMFETGSCTQLMTYGSDTLYAIFHATADDSYTVIQSKNDGQQGSWTTIKMPFGPDSVNMRVIKLDPNNNIWAFSGNGNMYKSMDNGETWVAFKTNYEISGKSANMLVENSLRSARAVNVLSAVEIGETGTTGVQELLAGSAAGVHFANVSEGSTNYRNENYGIRGLNIQKGGVIDGAVFGVDRRGGVHVNINKVPEGAIQQVPVLHASNDFAVHPNTKRIILAGNDGLVSLDEVGMTLEPIELTGSLKDKNVYALTYKIGDTPTLFGAYTEDVTTIAESEDDGANWKDIATLEPEFIGCSDMAMFGTKLVICSQQDGRIAFVDTEKPEEISYEVAATAQWSGFDVVFSFKGSLYAGGWDGISVKKDENSDFERVYQVTYPESNMTDLKVVNDKVYACFTDYIAEYNPETKALEAIDLGVSPTPNYWRFSKLFETISFDEDLKGASLNASAIYVGVENGSLWKIVDADNTDVTKIVNNKRSHVYPNPAIENVTIHFSVIKGNHVQLNIYNMAGQLVRTLANQEMPAGNYRFTWDGKDGSLNTLPNGQYVYHLSIGNQHESQKILLVNK